MKILYPLMITMFILSGLGYLVWMTELQSTVLIVLDKGGFYLDYSAGIGRIRLTGFRIRLMQGHGPRAWKRIILTGKYRPAAVKDVFQKATSRRLNPYQIPFRSIISLGIKIIIREINIQAKIGIQDDAAATALVCGCITTFLQALCAASTRGSFLPKDFIVIQPVYGHNHLSLRLKCILAINARQIIRETIKNRIKGINDK